MSAAIPSNTIPQTAQNSPTSQNKNLSFIQTAIKVVQSINSAFVTIVATLVILATASPFILVGLITGHTQKIAKAGFYTFNETKKSLQPLIEKLKNTNEADRIKAAAQIVKTVIGTLQLKYSNSIDMDTKIAELQSKMVSEVKLAIN
jgi:hypothetical protein